MAALPETGGGYGLDRGRNAVLLVREAFPPVASPDSTDYACRNNRNTEFETVPTPSKKQSSGRTKKAPAKPRATQKAPRSKAATATGVTKPAARRARAAADTGNGAGGSRYD